MIVDPLPPASPTPLPAATRRLPSALARIGLFVAVAACHGKGDDAGASATEATAATTAAETTGGTATTTTTTTTTTTGGATSTTAAETAGTTGSFIDDKDMVSTGFQCDIWEQDCPRGQKCMPWANDGSNSWNATKCSPIDPSPGIPGDVCSVVGSDVSGEDTCAEGSMCFAVNPDDGMGTCVAFCSGTPESPSCDEPETTCSVSNQGVLILCLPDCNPLLQDCPPGGGVDFGCYPVNGGFQCWSDYSGRGGGYGDPCQYFNVCDVGLFCAIPEAVPGCVSGGCCSEYCDITDPDAGMNCSGAGQGQTCIPWYDMGTAPPGLENVGYCGIP